MVDEVNGDARSGDTAGTREGRYSVPLRSNHHFWKDSIPEIRFDYYQKVIKDKAHRITFHHTDQTLSHLHQDNREDISLRFEDQHEAPSFHLRFLLHQPHYLCRLKKSLHGIEEEEESRVQLFGSLLFDILVFPSSVSASENGVRRTISR